MSSLTLFKKMTRSQKWLTVLCGFLTPVLCLSAADVSAQLKVAPLVIEAEADRGQAQGVFQITNPGNTAIEIEVYASPFTYDSSGFVELDSDPQDLTPYLFFSPQKLSLDPGQERRIRLSARLLPSMPDGEYRAVVFAQNQQPTTGEMNGIPVNITPRIGVLFFVSKGGTEPDLVPETATIETMGNQIELLVHNQGTASIRPNVRWQLTQNGAEIESGETPRLVLVAGESRPFSVEYNTPLEPGNYQFEGDIVQNSLSIPFGFDITIP